MLLQSIAVVISAPNQLFVMFINSYGTYHRRIGPSRQSLRNDERHPSDCSIVCSHLEHFAEVRAPVRIWPRANRGAVRSRLERTEGRARRKRGHRVVARGFGQSDL